MKLHLRDAFRALVGQRGDSSTVPKLLAPANRSATQLFDMGALGGISETAAVKRMVGWVYVCVSINAKAVASVPGRLYTTASRRAARGWDCRSVKTDRLHHILESEHTEPTVRSMIERAVYDGQKVREITGKHPWNKIMRNPNPHLHWFDCLEILVMYRQLLGSAHWYRGDNAAGVPETIWPLPSHKLKLIMRKHEPEAGWLWRGGQEDLVFPEEAAAGYGAFQIEGGDVKSDWFLPASDVIHFRRVNPTNPYGKGLSAVKAGLLPIDTEVLMEEYRRAVIENDGTPTFLLWTEQTLKGNTLERIVSDWRKQRDEAGPDMPGFVHGGLKPHTLGLSPKEMAFVEGAEQLQEQICAIFEVPLALVKTENVNKANALASKQQHRSETVRPMTSRIEGEVNTSLIWPYFGDDTFFAFDNPVPEDLEARARRNRLKIYSGQMTPNEGRADERLPPSIEEGADKLWMQGATQPLEILAAGSPEIESVPNPKEELQAAAAPCDHERATDLPEAPAPLVFAIRRVFEKQKDAVLEALPELLEAYRDSGGAITRASKAMPFGDEWAAEFDDATRAMIQAELQKGAKDGLKRVEAKLDAPAVAFDVTRPEAVEFLKSYQLTLSTDPVRGWPGVNAVTKQAVSRAVSQGIVAGENLQTVAARVAGVLDHAIDHRALRIARTETARAHGAGAEMAYIASGVVERKEWLQGRGPCPSGVCEINGEIVELGRAFSNGAETPPAHPNCTCAVAPVVAEAEAPKEAVPPPGSSRPATKTQLAKIEKAMGLDEGEWLWDTVHGWTDKDYREIRALQAGKQIKMTKEVRENMLTRLRRLEEFDKKAPNYVGKTYRGMGFKNADDLQVFLEEMKKGTIVEMNAASSATRSKAIARKFATEAALEQNRVIMEIAPDHGKSIEAWSRYPKEQEVLIGKGRSFRVVDVDEISWTETTLGKKIKRAATRIRLEPTEAIRFLSFQDGQQRETDETDNKAIDWDRWPHFVETEPEVYLTITQPEEE